MMKNIIYFYKTLSTAIIKNNVLISKKKLFEKQDHKVSIKLPHILLCKTCFYRSGTSRDCIKRATFGQLRSKMYTANKLLKCITNTLI